MCISNIINIIFFEISRSLIRGIRRTSVLFTRAPERLMDLLPYMVNSLQMLTEVTLVRPATVENRKYSGSSAPYIIHYITMYLLFTTIDTQY